ncbi:hypothetical protein SAMN04489835_4230 [Mycolicibacterium rutilum]|uniref:Uncharacterized protein n=1 Tax=Mycolicibacterium rutilum TaxID=370526 RepID=A0A1H6KZY6_MYCRU|nr:hypothetical protein [Mycolicibacterium rutilum]SEH79572.1 hypothetical protein SAMN04489835_4230 [Mycolicibacterium rutilum]
MSLRAVLVCHRYPPNNAEWTHWETIEQARSAAAELTPCGPLCIGVHSVVAVDIAAPPRADRSHGPRSRKTRAPAPAAAADS